MQCLIKQQVRWEEAVRSMDNQIAMLSETCAKLVALNFQLVEELHAFASGSNIHHKLLDPVKINDTETSLKRIAKFPAMKSTKHDWLSNVNSWLDCHEFRLSSLRQNRTKSLTSDNVKLNLRCTEGMVMEIYSELKSKIQNGKSHNEQQKKLHSSTIHSHQSNTRAQNPSEDVAKGAITEYKTAGNSNEDAISGPLSVTFEVRSNSSKEGFSEKQCPLTEDQKKSGDAKRKNISILTRKNQQFLQICAQIEAFENSDAHLGRSKQFKQKPDKIRSLEDIVDKAPEHTSKQNNKGIQKTKSVLKDKTERVSKYPSQNSFDQGLKSRRQCQSGAQSHIKNAVVKTSKSKLEIKMSENAKLMSRKDRHPEKTLNKIITLSNRSFPKKTENSLTSIVSSNAKVHYISMERIRFSTADCATSTPEKMPDKAESYKGSVYASFRKENFIQEPKTFNQNRPMNFIPSIVPAKSDKTIPMQVKKTQDFKYAIPRLPMLPRHRVANEVPMVPNLSAVRTRCNISGSLIRQIPIEADKKSPYRTNLRNQQRRRQLPSKLPPVSEQLMSPILGNSFSEEPSLNITSTRNIPFSSHSVEVETMQQLRNLTPLNRRPCSDLLKTAQEILACSNQQVVQSIPTQRMNN